MKKYALLTIYLTVFLDILGFGIIIPLLPFYAKNFGSNELMIGILLASNAVAQFIFNPVWGRISDKMGRKPVMIITVFGSTIAYFLFGFAASMFMLFVSRILSGISGASVGVAQSCVSDLTTKEERSKALGRLGAFFGLGFVFGPSLGGFLTNTSFFPSEIAFSLPGYTAAFLSFINLLMVIFFLPESNVVKSNENSKKQPFDWGEFNQVIRHPEMVSLFFIQFIAMFSSSIMFSVCALFLNAKYAYDASQTSYMFTFFGVCSAIIQGGFIGILVKKYGEPKLLIFGAVSMTLGLGMISYMPNLASLLFACFLIFFGNGVINPCITSLVSQRANGKQTGVTLGVSQSLGSLARIIGPVWGGYIFYIAGYHYPFVTASLFSVIVIFLAFRFVSQTQENKAKEPEPLPL